ncbi:LysR family transcriptional regulator [Amycolatopsis sp. NPDC049691]|uniref:LysR family transcriptional regulator n=1 Tax=Amycolatopsis sp. NPDC049691 TaxID=3155155 RepID=UPI00341EAE75
MELRALRYFVTVAEELHFGRAAERLNIVQPAVSHQIARLERDLGTRLLDRSPRHVRLTPAGERVLAAARDTLAAAARVRVVAGEPAARVRIGVTPGVTARLERAAELLREGDRPAEASLVDLPVPARLAAVRAGELDLALVRGPVDPAGLRVVRAWSEPLLAVVSDGHPLAERTGVPLGELESTPLRLPGHDEDPAMHDAVITALRQAGSPARARSEGSILTILIEIGAGQNAWTLLPAEQLTGFAARRVRALPLDPPLSVDGHIVASLKTPEICVSSFVRAFADAPSRLSEPAGPGSRP